MFNNACQENDPALQHTSTTLHNSHAQNHNHRDNVGHLRPKSWFLNPSYTIRRETRRVVPSQKSDIRFGVGTPSSETKRTITRLNIQLTNIQFRHGKHHTDI